jgi:hypothetical protein
MATKLTRLTHKISIQLHLVTESCTICVLAPDGQSGNFWIQPRIETDRQRIYRGCMTLCTLQIT